MADRWFYKHAGSVTGPVSQEQLKHLGARGALLPADLVWTEGSDPTQAVEAGSLLNFAALRRPRESSGEWLGKVAKALATAPRSPGATPDWISDVPPAPPGESAPVASTPSAPPAPTPKTRASRPAALPPVPSPPRLLAGGASSCGFARERNEDRFQMQQWSWNDAEGVHDVALLVLADGMGGYKAGDEASGLTVRTVARQLAAVVAAATNGQRTEGAAIAAALEEALCEANRVVHQQAGTQPRHTGMGATVAAVVLWDGWAYASHVGDCRVYLHRGSDLKQLTEDQTLVARMVALGQLTSAEAARHGSRNEVTQAIGKRPTVTPSPAEPIRLERGDYLVVACDGLAAHVEGAALRQALNESTVPPQHLASLLVSMADAAGGSDNCTVVVAQFA